MEELSPNDFPIPSASLDHYETNRHPLERQSHAQFVLHQPDAARRRVTIEALHNSSNPAHRKRAERMGFCCHAPTVNARRGNSPTVSPGRCKDRLCPYCQRTRATETKHRLLAKVTAADGLRFITLTQRADDLPPGEMIDRLLAAFTRFRHRKEWKAHVTGGAAVIELTRGKDGKHWHVHLHILAEGTFWHQGALQAEWSAAVGELAIVDVRAIPQRAKALNYVLGYMAKGMDCTDWTEDAILELADGIHRRRMVFTFGKWHRTNPDPADTHEEATSSAGTAIDITRIDDALQTGELDPPTVVPMLRALGRTTRLYFARWFTDDATPQRTQTPLDLAHLSDLLLALLTPDAPPDTPPVPHSPPATTTTFPQFITTRYT